VDFLLIGGRTTSRPAERGFDAWWQSFETLARHAGARAARERRGRPRPSAAAARWRALGDRVLDLFDACGALALPGGRHLRAPHCALACPALETLPPARGDRCALDHDRG